MSYIYLFPQIIFINVLELYPCNNKTKYRQIFGAIQDFSVFCFKEYNNSCIAILRKLSTNLKQHQK